MQEECIAKLLDDVKKIVIRKKAENYKTGKEFNIFYVQGIADDEVKVCRFFRELLDPEGSHGQGDVFLRRFVKRVLKIDESNFTAEDYKRASVTREERITDLRRIDIVIRIKNRVFPIEVKIYAKDQEGQCFDYYNYACRRDPMAKVYYLSLDGKSPSAESRKSLDKTQIVNISFSREILNWIEDCIRAPEIEQIYPVREILIQFRTVIERTTGIQKKGKSDMEIKEKISSSSDNMVAAIQISNTLIDVKTEKMRMFFEHINRYMSDLGWNKPIDLYEKEIDEYYKKKSGVYPGLSYVIPIDDGSVRGKLKLRIELEERLYIGICPISKGDKIQDAERCVIANLKPNFIETSTTSIYWYWWAYVLKDKDVNYRNHNEEYYKLYDSKEFLEYIKRVCAAIGEVVSFISKNCRLSSDV